MSVVHCDGCDNYVDVKDDVESVVLSDAHLWFCSRCLERAIEENEPDSACLAAWKETRPEEYAEWADQAAAQSTRKD